MKKKVAFLIPTLGGGGAERVLVNLLNNLNKEKYEITLISVFKGQENFKYLSTEIKYRYIFERMFRGNTLLFKLFKPEFLYRKIIKNEYDIVVSYLEGISTRIISGCPTDKTKLVSWVHIEIPEERMLLKSYRSMDEISSTYNQNDNIVFVSNTAKETFEETFPTVCANKQVIYNTVESDMIKKKSREIVNDVQFEENKVNLVSVGRFVEQKGYERLIEIIYKLKNKFSIHLYLIGKGPLEEKYKKMIKKYGLQDHVTIVGYNENPYKYVANCDLFVCSSYKEGFSTAVTESLIVGTPVITTRCSGMEEMLGKDNQYGMIVDNNEESLYEGLKKILENQKIMEHYKKQAQLRSSFFSTEQTVNDVENMFVNILSENEQI